jgi:predicted dehydrogenase
MQDKMKVIIAGCGGISGAKIEATRDRSDITYVGLVDLRLEAARELARRYDLQGCLVTDDLERAIEETGADIVFDCTVPEAHRDVTLTALAKGCHVLGEKPMADTMESALAMVEAAVASGRLFAVVQNRRYHQGIIALKDFLATGTLGDVTTIQSDFYIGAHFGGFRDGMKHVLLLDMSIHTFDAARFLAGADAEAVFAQDWNPKGSWYAHGASASALFTMTDGIRYTYNGSWCSEGLHTSWEAAWRIIGTRGSATWDGADTIRAQVVSGPPGGLHSSFEDLAVPVPRLPDARLGQAGVIGDFVAALRAGTTPQTVCTDNINSLNMVFGAIRSAEDRTPVAI